MTMCTVFYDLEQQETFEKEVQPFLESYECDFIAYDAQNNQDNFLNVPEGHTVLFWLADKDLYVALPFAAKQQWKVGFLPHPDMKRASRHFLVAKKMEEAVLNIFSAEKSISSGLMYCNDQLVLSSVMLGNPDAMKPASALDDGVWSKLKCLILMVFNLGKMRLAAYHLETFKERTIYTASLGITVVYRAENSDFTKRLVAKEEQDEPNLNAVILAPRSIIEVALFLFTRFFPARTPDDSLPSYLGYLKTESLTISGRSSLEYSVDGQHLSAEKLNITLQKHALQVLNVLLPEQKVDENTKELVKISGLPKEQGVKELVGRPLPWIHHSDLEEVKETFMTLSENAQSSQTYLVLMVLSTLLATVGLFANSAPVIIGAMILAPLMAPIVSLSMGVLRQNSELIFVSSKTLVAGIFLAIFFGTLFSLLVPLHVVNSEIGARLSPTLLDLGVAIISGIAAAYASARSEIAKSLAGVAIAVALVPPLAVAGIGLSWLDWSVFSGAFLLFITNLAGIILAAAATFFVMGFSPFHVAKKGIMLSLLFVAMISIPLVLSYNKMVAEQEVVYVLEGWKVDGIEVRNVKVRNGETLYISAKLVSNRPLEASEIDYLKFKMEALLDKKIQLETISAVVR